MKPTIRPSFPLFSTPIDLAHKYWKELLTDNSLVIDATCGNGRDSLALSLLLQEKKNTRLYCIDIQPIALKITRELLQEKASTFLPFVSFLSISHADIPTDLLEKTHLLVYNLGYLPKGDKSITTKVSSTLDSVRAAIAHISSGSVICLTCYPGHPEGKKEEENLLSLLSSLDPKEWSFTSCNWHNRNASPSLFLVQKI